MFSSFVSNTVAASATITSGTHTGGGAVIGSHPIGYLCSLTGYFTKIFYLLFNTDILSVFLSYCSIQICFSLQNRILRTRLCRTGFISQHCWVVDFHMINIIKSQCFLPGLYQLLSFFLSLVLKTQPNHWTKRMVITRSTTWETRDCTRQEDTGPTFI